MNKKSKFLEEEKGKSKQKPTFIFMPQYSSLSQEYKNKTTHRLNKLRLEKLHWDIYKTLVKHQERVTKAYTQ